MLRRNTIVLVGIFVFLLAFAIFLQRGADDTTSDITPTITPSQFLLDFGSDDVVGLKIESDAGQVVELAQKDLGTWMLIEPPTIAEETDQQRISSILNGMVSIRIVNPLESAPQLVAVGLDKPAYEITITFVDDLQREIRLGNESPTGNGYYVMVDEETPILVDQSSLNQAINLLETPPILAMPISGDSLE